MSVKGRVLALHGFAQTAPGFSNKSSKLRKLAKQQGIELVYMNGPIVLTHEDLPFEANKLGAEGNEFRGWWTLSKDFDMTSTVDKISDFIKENGPFDGVLGFSQGAAMAQLITNHMEELGNTKPVRFGIYFSGFVCENSEVNAKYLTKKINIPTLHIMGELDTLVSNDASLEFVEKYTELGTAEVFKHPGGHYVPHQAGPVRSWVQWMLEALKTDEDRAREAQEELERVEKLKEKQRAKASKRELAKKQKAEKVKAELENSQKSDAAPIDKDKKELEDLMDAMDKLGTV